MRIVLTKWRRRAIIPVQCQLQRQRRRHDRSCNTIGDKQAFTTSGWRWSRCSLGSPRIVVPSSVRIRPWLLAFQTRMVEAVDQERLSRDAISEQMDMKHVRRITRCSQLHKVIIDRERQRFFSGRINHQFITPQVIEVAHRIGQCREEGSRPGKTASARLSAQPPSVLQRSANRGSAGQHFRAEGVGYPEAISVPAFMSRSALHEQLGQMTADRAATDQGDAPVQERFLIVHVAAENMAKVKALSRVSD